MSVLLQGLSMPKENPRTINIYRDGAWCDAYTTENGKAIEDPTLHEMMPVVFGRWYWDKDGMDWGIGAWRCSACEAMSPMWWNTDKGSPMHKSGHRFCPNCGARMIEKEDDEA